MLTSTPPFEFMALNRSTDGGGGRLVVLSNRMAPTQPGEAPKGGLAVGLVGALKASGGLWMGWSGQTRPQPGSGEPTVSDNVSYVPVDLTDEQIARYYRGFSNQTLWPACHYRTDLIKYEPEFFEGYREVNALFARELKAFLKPDDVIWVHDYHLMLVGRELRRLGVENPIGFFLHTPFPSYDAFRAVPEHKTLLKAMFAYDLVGFHTDAFVENFRDCCDRVLEVPAAAGPVRYMGETARLGAFPIGIDAERMAEYAKSEAATMRHAAMVDSFLGAKICIGVDRLDYSKGIPERLRAFARLLDEHPKMAERATFLQIAPPSRDDVQDYKNLRDEVVRLAGEINARHNSPEWVAIRFVHKSFSRKRLAGYYRASRVGLVTPLRDGMNLVAKEYVVCQSPASPGVLILSEFAGAAGELGDGALCVNPLDIDGVADALKQALDMPVEERRERHKVMLDAVMGNTAADWSRNFLEALGEGGAAFAERVPLIQ